MIARRKERPLDEYIAEAVRAAVREALQEALGLKRFPKRREIVLGEYAHASEVYACFGGKSAVAHWIAKYGMPSGIRISPKVTIWRRSELAAWVAARQAQQTELIEKRSRIAAQLVEGRKLKRQAAERRRQAAEAQADA